MARLERFELPTLGTGIRARTGRDGNVNDPPFSGSPPSRLPLATPGLAVSPCASLVLWTRRFGSSRPSDGGLEITSNGLYHDN